MPGIGNVVRICCVNIFVSKLQCSFIQYFKILRSYLEKCYFKICLALPLYFLIFFIIFCINQIFLMLVLTLFCA